MLSLEDYGLLTTAIKEKVHTDQLEKLIEDQLALLNNDPNVIRNVITTTINQAIDKKFEQLSKEPSEDTKRLFEENAVMRKVIVEQQICLERLCNDM